MQNLNQQNFAKMLGISTASLSGLFSGRTQPTLNTATAISKAFPNISYEWLLNGEGEMFKNVTPASNATPSQSSQISQELQNANSKITENLFDIQEDKHNEDLPLFVNTVKSESVANVQQGMSTRDNDLFQQTNPQSSQTTVDVPYMDHQQMQSPVYQEQTPSLQATSTSQYGMQGYSMRPSVQQMPTSQTMTSSMQQQFQQVPQQQVSSQQNVHQVYSQVQQIPGQLTSSDRRRKITEIRIYFDDQTYEIFAPSH